MFDDVRNLILDLEGAMCLVKLLQSSVTEANAHVVERAHSWCDSIGAAYVRLSPPTEADEHGHTVALDCKDMGQLMGLLATPSVISNPKNCSSINCASSCLLTRTYHNSTSRSLSPKRKEIGSVQRSR